MQTKTEETYYVVILGDKFYANDFNGNYSVMAGNQPWTKELNAAKMYHDRRKAQAMINRNVRAQDAAVAKGDPDSYYYIPGCNACTIQPVTVTRQLTLKAR